MPSQEVRHARLLKPFSVRRVEEALYHVITTGHGIYQSLHALQSDTPTLPETWWGELQHIRNELAVLAEYCEWADPLVKHIQDSADADFQRSVDAMVAVMRGLAEQPWRDAAEPDAA